MASTQMTEPRYGQGDASFQAAGGVDGVQRRVEDFYEVMNSREYTVLLTDINP